MRASLNFYFIPVFSNCCYSGNLNLIFHEFTRFMRWQTNKHLKWKRKNKKQHKVTVKSITNMYQNNLSYIMQTQNKILRYVTRRNSSSSQMLSYKCKTHVFLRGFRISLEFCYVSTGFCTTALPGHSAIKSVSIAVVFRFWG